MKITALKLANAIKAGRNERIFLEDDMFDMNLQDGLFIKVVQKSDGYTVMTSVMNTIWFKTETDGQGADAVARGRRRKVGQ